MDILDCLVLKVNVVCLALLEHPECQATMGYLVHQVDQDHQVHPDKMVFQALPVKKANQLSLY